MSPDVTSAAILAGGQARRFGGRDKSRLVVDGRPIIVRQVEILQSVASSVAIIAPDATRFADLGVPVIPDLVPSAGAIGGIYTAVATSQADRVLVVACDLPHLDAGLLALLAERAGDADGAWVETARGPEPLLACYRRGAADRIHAAIRAGRMRAGDLGRVLQMRAVGPVEIARFGDVEHLLANVNTPADYARVQYVDS